MSASPGSAQCATRRLRRGLALAATSLTVLAVCVVGAAPADAAVTWTVQSSPTKQVHISDFQATSCPTTTFCMTVGSHGKGTYQVARAERYNGTSWTNTTVPTTATHFSWLYGVSCTSATACTAVGADATSKAYGAWGYATVVPDKIRPLIMRWNGTTWAAQTSPTPTTWTFSFLRGVSCVSATHCVAVGFHGASPVIGVWNGGAWSLQSAAANPLLSTEVRFTGVSCTSTTSCIAVGRYTTTSDVRALAEKWDGSVWSLAAPIGPTGNTEFNGVSCTSSTACIGVGGFQSGSNPYVPLVESWDGASWTTVTTPVIAGGAHLRSVSCKTSTSCMAVGVNKQSGHTKTLAFRMASGVWSTTSIPNVTADDFVNGVSCASTTACIAVGYDTADVGAAITNKAMAAQWNGSTWSTATTAPDTTPLWAGSDYAAVSCPSSTFCTAVGHDHLGPRAVSGRWDGTAWHNTAQPDLSDTGYLIDLNGVSCRSTSACIAVGRRVWQAICACQGDEGHPLAESWNGTKWTLLTPAKPNTYASFAAVSCSTATACTAVGGGDTNTPLIQRWNGTSWSSQTAAVPSSFSIANLAGVSCTSSTFCMAVGTHEGSAHGGWATRWNGTSWTRFAVPSPTGASSAALNGVSCKSTTACTAVGYWVDSTNKQRRLVERWNGTTWTVFDKQSAGGAEQQLTGVSCTSATACMAVGTKRTSTYDQTLAWHSGSTTFSTSSPMNPGVYGNDLAGVSCTSSFVCTAVGKRAVAAGTATLAERSAG